ncbi:MAG: hypothetical protein UY31_C0005G0006 [Candidatus Wolfebacteria bacterium GW2011_GWE1_48_7]|uniref:Uncharacterized protein n=2 Tax=Candidatus Wolfeibacteriota TaxID=1752735 RepID=A0A0G1U8G5_9BACT|nr:MAG: hypothetical protein UX70_C0001G0242 [Candidatus Wolfebacteria bacterium GW2011_GWB1_47_1]KKU36367.1 MAG: hypothetical protein UX49_C0017G0005 [Candidatus Wolfebacteria bacterium GW2011_GWC2_46_275]KKU42042.1 MAG: hypothetical protein UX58_C0004G0101 [Candidatus Wolfebacteria bacterium GW2011_GWB2_46_69]KKU54421.1 MAG: hypothetical protein UX76_C0002G0014 [Candidatus Wolfebacteria bacterium GW2011_GWC1_47_103]KKU59749.1 MAG: hypothetical protein UX83_C0002G0036 [Candidatus Wolfebacteria
MNETNFVFPLEQRTLGCCLVCPCCNEVVANGAPYEARANQRVHTACAKRFDLVMKIKPDVEGILDGVPQQVLEGTDLPGRLSRACTIVAIRMIVTDFCVALQEAKKWLKEQFEELAQWASEQLIPIGQRVQVTPQQIMKYLAV